MFIADKKLNLMKLGWVQKTASNENYCQGHFNKNAIGHLQGFSRHRLVILDFPDFNSVWPRAITGFMSKEKKPKEQQSRLNQCEVKIKPQKLLKCFYSVNEAK